MVIGMLSRDDPPHGRSAPRLVAAAAAAKRVLARRDAPRPPVVVEAAEILLGELQRDAPPPLARPQLDAPKGDEAQRAAGVHGGRVAHIALHHLAAAAAFSNPCTRRIFLLFAAPAARRRG